MATNFNATFNESVVSFTATFNTGGDRWPDYEGSYTVTPHITAQTMLTKDRSMTQNVNVLSIPYSEVSNPSGLTVYIGD